MGQVVEATQLVSHGMHEAKGRIVERHARQKLRVRHAFPRPQVFTVLHHQAQVMADQGDGLQGAGIGDRSGSGGHVGFDGVGQGIHAGGGRQALGHGDHQVRIVDRQQRRDVAIDNGHFHVPRFIGDDAEPGHFAGRAGRGVDGNQRQLRFSGPIDALVVANLPAVGRAQGDPLGTVVGRAPAQGHHEVTPGLLEQTQAVLDVGDAGVGFGAVEDHRIDVLQRQFPGNHARHAGLGQPGVGDDERFAKTVLADGVHGFVQATDAHDVHGGDKKRTNHVRVS